MEAAVERRTRARVTEATRASTRHGRLSRRRAIGLGLWVLAAAMVVGVMIGSTTLGASTVLDALWGRVTGREATGAVADQIVWQIRLPRVLLAAVVGAALTTSGTVVIAHHVVGSPATCVDRLATIVEHTAVARVVLVVEAAVTPAAVLDNVRRLGREVLPHVRERLRAEEDQSSMRIESNMASRSAMS